MRRRNLLLGVAVICTSLASAGAGETREAADGDVVLEALGVNVTAGLEGQAALTFVEGVVRAGAFLAQ